MNLKASKCRKFGDSVKVTKWCSFSVDAALHNIAGYEDWLRSGVKVECDEWEGLLQNLLFLIIINFRNFINYLILFFTLKL